MFRTKERTLLDRQLERALRDLDRHLVGSKAYEDTLGSVIKLHKMREEEKPRAVSKDTLLVVGANLFGIFMILQHEHFHPITSRAMNLILRPPS